MTEVSAPTAPDAAPTTPDYCFATATEPERWAYDCGYEDGFAARLDPELMDLNDIRDEVLLMVAALTRMIAETQAERIAS